MSFSDLKLAFTPLLPLWALVALGVLATAVLLFGAMRGQRGLVLRALATALILAALADPSDRKSVV